MKCKNCGQDVLENWAMCPFCGTPIEKKKLCAKCGAELQPNWIMCPFCGEAGLPKQTPVAQTVHDDVWDILPNTDDVGIDVFDGLDLVGEDIAEAIQREKDSANATYLQKLNLARIACIRKNYKQAKDIYDELVNENIEDVNAYIGFIRIASQNYTVFEGEEIDEAIDIAQQIAEKDLSLLDKDYAAYAAQRKQRNISKPHKTSETAVKASTGKREADKQAEQRYLEKSGMESFENKNYLDAIAFWEGISNPTADLQLKLAYSYFSVEDYAKALELYLKLANQGNAEAQYQVGYMHQKAMGVSGSFGKAIEWYTKASTQGHLEALCSLAICYENGSGIMQNLQFAIELYTKAAMKGSAKAQYMLGRCYINGRGVPTDFPKAVQWLEKSAEQGYDQAQLELALLLKRSYPNVPVDYKRSYELFLAAAEQGNVVAQRQVASCFKNGLGVKQNISQAKCWYLKAAEKGDQTAKEELRLLTQKN